jgi:glycosyltransferase involved in cell wall biosynthesis
MGITVHDSVSREVIEREMATAECLAYPCDTVRWSEGFSCTLLEGCAARACPVTLETDCFKQVYGGVVPMVPRDRVAERGDGVILALTDKDYRDRVNDKCAAFAAEHTWEATAREMVRQIEEFRVRKAAA